jgi:hypothetical protein
MKSFKTPVPARADRTTPDTCAALPRQPEHSSLTAEEIREIVAQILG